MIINKERKTIQNHCKVPPKYMKCLLGCFLFMLFFSDFPLDIYVYFHNWFPYSFSWSTFIQLSIESVQQVKDGSWLVELVIGTKYGCMCSRIHFDLSWSNEIFFFYINSSIEQKNFLLVVTTIKFLYIGHLVYFFVKYISFVFLIFCNAQR